MIKHKICFQTDKNMILLYIGSFPYTWGGSMNKPYAYYEHKKLKSFKELLEFNYKKIKTLQPLSLKMQKEKPLTKLMKIFIMM